VTKAYLEELFADQIDGRRLLVNNSRWGNFRTRRTTRWSTLAPGRWRCSATRCTPRTSPSAPAPRWPWRTRSRWLPRSPSTPGAGRRAGAYEAAAQPSVRVIQGSARPSLSWWEHFGRYHDAFEPWQFGYHFLSRSITDSRLARRDPEFVADTHQSWLRAHGRAAGQ